MESSVQNLIKMERSEPKRRIAASPGALYATVLVGVIAVIMLSYDLAARFSFPRAYVQLALYALLIALSYCIYRFRLLAYRYTLTDRMLSVDRIVGTKERFEAQLHISDITSVRPADKKLPRGVRQLFAPGGGITIVSYTEAGAEKALALSLSDDFIKELLSQWKKSR